MPIFSNNIGQENGRPFQIIPDLIPEEETPTSFLLHVG
jgi:hypothetical protein